MADDCPLRQTIPFLRGGEVMKQQHTFKRGISRRDFFRITGMAAAGMATGSWLAACTPAETTAPTVPTATAGPPLKIGLLLPYTAVYAELGNSIERGMRMYFDETGNEAGGRAIEIITEDEGATPDEATPRARKLVEQDEVDIVAGIVSF